MGQALSFSISTQSRFYIASRLLSISDNGVRELTLWLSGKSIGYVLRPKVDRDVKRENFFC